MHQGRQVFFHFLDDRSIHALHTESNKSYTECSNDVGNGGGGAPGFSGSIAEIVSWLDATGHHLNIIASDILVVFAAIAILKVWKNHHLNRMRTSLMINFEKRWKEKEKVRPSMTNCLFQLYKDLRITSKRFYEEYKENDFISEDERIDDIIARRIIEEEIIQPKSIGPRDLMPIITNERNNEESASVSSPVSMLAPLDEDEQ